MTEPLAVILAPDVMSVDPQSVLNAALYFDVVYADCYSFSQSTESHPVVVGSDGSLEFALDSHFAKGTSYAPLRDAQILMRPPGADLVEGSTVDYGDALPETLRQLISNSIRDGAVMSVIEWVVNAVLADRHSRPRDPTAPVGRGLKITLPATINVDTLTNDVPEPTRALALSFQLGTMLNTLKMSASCSATPLLDSQANAELAHALVAQFPEVAAALNRRHDRPLPWKHVALASRVLDDTLLNVKVRDAEDILHLRELLAPELFAFRAELSRLTAALESQPWEARFSGDAETIIATNIRPQLAALERRLTNPSRRILKHLVTDWKSVSAMSLLPFSACVLQGANAAWAALAGVCAGLGLSAIRAKLEEWSAREDSALTFLIEVRRKAIER